MSNKSLNTRAKQRLSQNGLWFLSACVFSAAVRCLAVKSTDCLIEKWKAKNLDWLFFAAFVTGIIVVIFLWQSKPLPTEIHAQTNVPNIETNELKSPQQITENSVNALSNSAIGKIDFGNFSYPKLWKQLEKPAKLKNGELVFEGKYRCTTTISFDEVKYLDLTNDGEDDALVILNNQVACGSSSGAMSFLVFTMRNKKP